MKFFKPFKRSLTQVAVSCSIGEKKVSKEYDIATFFQAALNGDKQIVEAAITNGFNPNSVDETGKTALMLAAYNGHLDIVNYLIKKRVDVNTADSIKRTALMYAASGPFSTTVSALLEAGAKPNLTEKEQNWTAAMMAAAEGQLEVLKELVANGAYLKMGDVDGETAFQFAEANGHTEVANYIKEQIGH